ncbi:MAG TPA: hypothetical protein VEO54_26545 [Thermoanaerobaculia bacterium]|nr:hypothetical protein [Thermoanaerobaculia bacterium]
MKRLKLAALLALVVSVGLTLVPAAEADNCYHRMLCTTFSDVCGSGDAAGRSACHQICSIEGYCGETISQSVCKLEGPAYECYCYGYFYTC